MCRVCAVGIAARQWNPATSTLTKVTRLGYPAARSRPRSPGRGAGALEPESGVE